jgi:dUTP pyrophosphatase
MEDQPVNIGKMPEQAIIHCKLEDFVIKQGKRLGIDFTPTRAHDTDAGADIRCVRGFTVKAHGTAVVNTGVHVELPPGTKCEVKSKSGLWINHGIITTGLIDEGFSGTIKVGLANLSDTDYTFAAGDKVSQLVVSPVIYPTYEPVSAIQGGDRGESGYGSTGTR